MINKLKRLKIVVFFFRMTSPGFGYCMKCKLPWNHCEPRTVSYNQNSGTFATCQYCWEHSELEELKNYFSMVYTEQYRQSGKHNMGHTREHLLDCVEKEFGENIKIARRKKVIFLQKKIKKEQKKNVALFEKN